MKRALFIDRDGTLIVEPPEDFQVDTLEKLEFIPGVFRNLYFIRKNFDYELVIVSNQDGLGTPSYPYEAFEKVQNKMLKAFLNEGIKFDDILIDPSLPEENSENRKPRTGMLKKYMTGEYDLKSSYVIGDRITDVELAKNLGCKAILIGDSSKKELLAKSNLEEFCVLVTNHWDDIYLYLLNHQRYGEVTYETSETKVNVKLHIDGTGKSEINTGIGFFDHMLNQIAKHSGIDLYINTQGDLHVDEHHTIEDTGIALGKAFSIALKDKKGIERYGFVLPMDDSVATVAIDFSGRSWLVWEVVFKREKIGDMPTEMFMHFFKSFADNANCNIYIKAEGENDHHKAEAVFKAFGRAIKNAIRREPFNFELPSTKGKL